MMDQDDKDIMTNYAVLDKIDFIPYLKKETNLLNIINDVEKDYDNTELTNNGACNGCIFNWLDEDEIACYLMHRYGNRVRRHVECVTDIYIELQDEPELTASEGVSVTSSEDMNNLRNEILQVINHSGYGVGNSAVAMMLRGLADYYDI